MSVTVTVIAALPGAQVAWPLVASAASSALTSLGFSLIQRKAEVKSGSEKVTLEVPQSQVVSQNMAEGQKMEFYRDGVTVVFQRDHRGKFSVCVEGEGKTKKELYQMGEQISQHIVQQYAYHCLVTELKSRNFQIVEEQRDQDGTVKLQARTFVR